MKGTAELIAQPLRGRYQGERHSISLALSAVLIDHGAEPSGVPALVEAIAVAAGWNDPDNHRQAAESTVSKAAAGNALRKDLPPAVRTAVQRVFNARPPDEPPGIDVVSERLFRAIRDAPDGASLIVAACGVGKSHQARRVAVERAKKPGKLDTKTAISASSNELAIQYADRLRESGAKVLRVFGPASVPGPHDGHECRYWEAARALAHGGQSVRWELCEGRNRYPCAHRLECKAVDGQEGDEGARIVVGNHGLVADLDGRAGKTGLLVLDEPRSPIRDEVMSDVDLHEAKRWSDQFVLGYAFDPIVDGLLDAMALAQRTEPKPIAELAGIDLDVDGILTDELGRRRHAPQLLARAIAQMRSAPSMARLVGEASRVLRALCWAYSQPDVKAGIYQSHRGKKYLALTGLDDRLASAIRRDGRVVLMAADADLHHEAVEQVVRCGVETTCLRAKDGCRVRRVHIYTKSATRRQWLVLKRSPKRALENMWAILGEVDTDRILVVTFKGLVDTVRRLLPADVAVHHYGATRGVDKWKGFDAVVTLGDHIPPLDFVERTTFSGELDERAEALCAAELEQAHGRLRTIHRERPALQVHIGRVRPRGWPADVEEHELFDGRPRHRPVDPAELRRLVDVLGGVSVVARLIAQSRRTIQRWLKGATIPAEEVMADLRMRAASAEGGS